MQSPFQPSSREKLRILLIGSGGREHALAWRLADSPLVSQVFVAPGNGGTALGERVGNVNISADDFEGLAAFATGSQVNLVIPGPEQPLVDGIEQIFRRSGIPVFGPSKEAARMEGSKTFAKDFMRRHDIPTAAYRNFSNVEAARSYVQQVQHRVVIKATGLAAGKGVLLPETLEEALGGLDQIMVHKAFGEAGDEVVVEEFLEGQELSILAFCDGYTVLPLPGAQDHKRIGDGDTGPNTGGMGAYSPAPIATPALNDTIMQTILKPTLRGMRKDGWPFVGLLFVGLMITATGPKVLEYNVRFGDPETQTMLPLLSPSTDLAEVMLACVERRLDCVKLSVRPEASVTVVLASAGYPEQYQKGKEIRISALPRGVSVFQAGTVFKNDQLQTAGGRVLGVNAVASTLEDAAALAYRGVQAIHFDGMIYRRDIAHKALKPHQINGIPKKALTYADAGVSIDAGNELVERIKPFVKATRRPGAEAEIGGFGGTFDLKAIGYRDPVLVSGTDGVGTKLKAAQAIGKHDTIGVDLVAMSVNDLVVQGAEPLYFLDYFACGKLDVQTAAEVVKGIADGCKQSHCALIGGETAEMPSMYQGNDYDLAGFAVGAVERDQLLPIADIRIGDVVLGLASSGVHSNGFSLIRRVLGESGLSYESPCPWQPSQTLGHVLLQPTVIYVRQLLSVLHKLPGAIKALSHITGGGFIDNIPRVLPADRAVEVDAASYPLPPLFRWLMGAGNIEPLEMARTFNCGVGMVAIISRERVSEVEQALSAFSEGAQVFRIGSVISGQGVTMKNLQLWKESAASQTVSQILK